jgi:hypothetical protein
MTMAPERDDVVKRRVGDYEPCACASCSFLDHRDPQWIAACVTRMSGGVGEAGEKPARPDYAPRAQGRVRLAKAARPRIK